MGSPADDPAGATLAAGSKRQASNGSPGRDGASSPDTADAPSRPPGRLFGAPQWTGGASFISPVSKLPPFAQSFTSAAAAAAAVGAAPAGVHPSSNHSYSSHSLLVTLQHTSIAIVNTLVSPRRCQSCMKSIDRAVPSHSYSTMKNTSS